MTLDPRLITPAILNLPLQRLAIGIQVYGLESHCVGGATVKGLDALSLVHCERITEKRSIVVVVECCDPLRAVKFTTHIARVIHHRIVLERCDSHLLDLIHGEVDVRPVLTIVSVAVIFDLIDLVVRTRRIIHQHHKLPTEVSTYKALVEGLRCIGLCRDGLALLITKRIREGRWGDTEVKA